MSDSSLDLEQHPLHGERIEDVDVLAEMETSFLEYALSVIYSRALPDARDGLKPVQRRILYMMTDMGLRPDKGHVKSARVVGEVMGKLHPHGDSSIYDALVRLAQPFAMRLPLVDGHGNFGSLDDGPAASRYTEARLAGAALAMTADLDEDVVDFVPNYDNQFMQPGVLPSAVPNLLVNGASGIAVGMATNLAPHNLIEVVEGAKHLLYNPQATTEDLMSFIPGPDLPGGGIIVGLDGIKEAYETGRGAFKTRAKVAVEKVSARRTGLVVTELPYLVGPERVIERIKIGVENKKISGIADVVDLTDRKNGLRMLITLKSGFSPEGVLEQLYRTTPLEDSFSINSVALVDGQPQTLGLKEMLRVFLDHRISVITRRSNHRLTKRKERLHLVEGMLLAIVDIDAVIQIIRASENTEQAKDRLKTAYDFSDLQAEYILELRLRRLTKFSRVELETEQAALIAEIEALQAILADRDRLYGVVASEMDEAAERYGTPRRTLLTGAVLRPTRSKEKAALEVQDAPCRVLLSATGLALRIDVPEAAEGQSTLTAALERPKPHGAVHSEIHTTTRAEIGAVLADGTVHRFTPVELPHVPANSISFEAGVPIERYLGLDEKKSPRVVGFVALGTETPIGMFTRDGVVKRTSLETLPNKDTFEIITLKDADVLVSVFEAPDNTEFAAVTSDAQLLRFSASLVRPQGLSAGGMNGMNVKAGASVLFAAALPEEAEAQVVTVAQGADSLPGVASCSTKVSDFAEFPAKGRATGGVRAHRFLKGEDRLCAAWIGAGEPRALGENGEVRDLPEELGRRDGSGYLQHDGDIAYVGSAPTAEAE
ncbi:DNA gyrase/topoisomerase IV subunit A [Leucobacter chinensis]|uniref:DNA gyrase/topoisomerase IV subunit A n=1 Tax=Leucobacter chinensis TaxID=2851010 RepID=UPI00350E9BDE